MKKIVNPAVHKAVTNFKNLSRVLDPSSPAYNSANAQTVAALEKAKQALITMAKNSELKSQILSMLPDTDFLGQK